MTITRVELRDFLVFKGEFGMDFCPGVNVLIGGNGTGKTTLMKAMYRLCDRNPVGISGYFYGGIRKQNFFDFGHFELKSGTDHYGIGLFGKNGRYNNRGELVLDQIESISNEDINENPDAYFDIFKVMADGYKVISSDSTGFVFGSIKEPPFDAVYIPATEMLSHARGLLALDRERSIPFDKTEIDIIAKAQLSPTRQLTPNATKVMHGLTEIVGGEVGFDGDDFYIKKDEANSGRTYFSFEASGYRKLGTLWKLLRNGLLESGTVLFWDEPENSLNPELVPVLVKILLKLAKNGVQIFIATHDYNIARYFDVRKDKNVPVLFHNLSKGDNGQIICSSSPNYLKLPNNLLETASEDLFRAVVNDGFDI